MGNYIDSRYFHVLNLFLAKLFDEIPFPSELHENNNKKTY